jgi:hypothetical protein
VDFHTASLARDLAAKGLPLRAVSLEGQAAHFELPTQIGIPTFEGVFRWNIDSGSFVQGSARGSFTLAREGTPCLGGFRAGRDR